MKNAILFLTVVVALVVFGVGQMALTFELSQPQGLRVERIYSESTWSQWSVPQIEHPNAPFGWQFIQERTNQFGFCEMRIVLQGQ